jgi:aminomethyltransferase
MHLLQEIHTLKKTPLHDRHVSLNAKMVSFGGWSMPVYYRGILEEHRWVRESCGIFDVSHLGEFHVHGRGAFAFLQARVTNDLRKLSNGKILYALLCDEKGFALDDLLIYQEALDDYYVIVNAANIERDFEAFLKYLPDSVKLENRSDVTACVAVQGPRSEEILKRVFGFDLNSLGYYCFKLEKTRWGPVWISRSGYTGEDGFEIFSSNDGILPVWDALVETGESGGLVPAGLGARNTLRLEAGNALYGNDLDETTTPLEAGLHWAVSFEKGGFVGRDGLMKQKEGGLKRRLVGFKMLDKSIAREHYPIFRAGKKVGEVTSGSLGPTVGVGIGLGYVAAPHADPGTALEIEVHGRKAPAEAVKLPFVASNHKKG